MQNKNTVSDFYLPGNFRGYLTADDGPAMFYFCSFFLNVAPFSP